MYIKDEDFKEICEWIDAKPVEAVANVKAILEGYISGEARLPLGSYVVDIGDEDLSDLAVVTFDHMIHDYDLYFIRRLSDKNLSTRDSTQIKPISPEQAMRAWCGDAIHYGD